MAVLVFIGFGTLLLSTPQAQAQYVYYSGTVEYQVVSVSAPKIKVFITASPDTVTIPQNQTTLTWSTSGSPDSCTASNAWTGAKNEAGGSELISGLTPGNYVFDITCQKAGATDATASALVVVDSGSTPSGTLSATDCIIPVGGASCSDTVSWTTSSLTANPTEITRNTGTPTSFTPSPLASGSISRTISYGMTTFYLYHNAVMLAQSSALASCAAGSVWNGSICQPAVTATLSANPSSINSGDSSTLTWSSANANSCLGTGFATGNATSGSTIVTPSTTTTYYVVCTGPAGSDQAQTTVTVRGTVNPECSDGVDNDGDTKVDGDDPGCHTDGDATNKASYDPNDTSEVDKRKPVFIEF